jgi:hypothetical protein
MPHSNRLSSPSPKSVKSIWQAVWNAVWQRGANGAAAMVGREYVDQPRACGAAGR